jgi:16S rRNA (guanine527-N7)-methyltransferase
VPRIARPDPAAPGVTLPAEANAQLATLASLVETAPFALTSTRVRESGIGAHVADSLAGLMVPALREADSIADLGSGGGFPGLVLAIALPTARVTLLESVGKKAAFLEQAAAGLGLSNVGVVGGRIEDWEPGLGTQSAVTARALAPLGVLIEYAAPILRIGGTLVAWKGPSVAEELPDANAAAELLGMSAPAAVPGSAQSANDQRTLYVSSKLRNTPSGYPRPAGKARKRPIRA